MKTADYVDKTAVQRYLCKQSWLELHWGVITSVAESCGVSRQMVNAVFWGKKTSTHIWRELVKRGAPMFGREPVPRKPRAKVTA
jgi:hypothetical protein